MRRRHQLYLLDTIGTTFEYFCDERDCYTVCEPEFDQIPKNIYNITNSSALQVGMEIL